MSLYITSLNSGSNGNCYYVGNETEAVLIDAGISCREIERRMKRLNISIEKVKAVFVSHEHTDHIRGIPSLLKKYQLPVYINSDTLKFARLYLENHLVKNLKAHETVSVGELQVTAFPKWHDASDPCSFVVANDQVTIGIFTDIGLPCENVINYFQKCHAAFLEANYDEEMLEKGTYPFHLKKRIKGERGHLSNRQALELFKKYRSPYLTHLLLSHLSQNNNSPKIVEEIFSQHSKEVQMIIASRYQETPVYKISSRYNLKQHYNMLPAQLELFE